MSLTFSDSNGFTTANVYPLPSNAIMLSDQSRPSDSIHNSSQIVSDAHEIFHSAIDAVSPLELSPLIQEVALPDSSWVVGAGKAAMAMAATLEQSFPSHSFDGHVVVPSGYIQSFPEGQHSPQAITVREGGHPIPDEESLRSATDALKIAESLCEQDTLIVLLSGGASALWSLPVGGLTLGDQQKVNRQLLESGAEIHQMNTVRKHLSQIKGGQLAKVAWPAQVITLAISDVIGDDASVIGSGPTVYDPTTWQDVAEIIHHYNIDVSPAIFEHIRLGINGHLPDTPKPNSSPCKHASFRLLVSNCDAIEGARKMAAHLGYDVMEMDSDVDGEARDVGIAKAQRVLSLHAGQCVIWGGETTVTVQGSGKGGRNQEVALAAACELNNTNGNVMVLSGGTDGIDGPTDAAGGWATSETLDKAKSKGMDLYEALTNNDAYHCLKAMDQLIVTGPTHTNVMDIGIGLRGHE